MAKTETAVFTIHINATKEAVWQELTKTDSPQDAMWHTMLHSTGLAPGASYQMRTPDGRFVNAVGEILAYEPPHRLQQTMAFARFDEPPLTLTYEIVDHPDGGVDVTLTIDDLPTDTKVGKSWRGSGGANWMLGAIKKIVEDGQLGWSTRLMYRLFDVGGSLVNPKSTKAELWPLDE